MRASGPWSKRSASRELDSTNSPHSACTLVDEPATRTDAVTAPVQINGSQCTQVTSCVRLAGPSECVVQAGELYHTQCILPARLPMEATAHSKKSSSKAVAVQDGIETLCTHAAATSCDARPRPSSGTNNDRAKISSTKLRHEFMTLPLMYDGDGRPLFN